MLLSSTAPSLSPISSEDTICALATAPGGALGIIRVSGPQALSIVSSVCRGITAPPPANTIHYAHIAAFPPSERQQADEHRSETKSDESLIDEALVSIFHAPHSYTGEDSAEISCHGSHYIINKILDILVQNGCRMANPGEFTQRAYLNGKLDLSQAEAVADLIASTNQATHRLAMSQLRGGISTELSQLRDQLLKLTSLLELELDFSDHEDLEFADRTELFNLAQHIDNHIIRLAHTFETGQALKQGIPVAIVGKTNVGKSTLLNRLLGDDRAIVSDIHGTTRDTIEDTIDIQGVTFRFIDTAGIRQTTDQIEQIGIDRTYQAIDRARIVLWLFDEQPTKAEVANIVAHTQRHALLPICNKIDTTENKQVLPPLPSPLLKISAKTGQGIEALEQAIYQAADLPAFSDSNVIVTNARHYDALVRAHTSIQRVIEHSASNYPVPSDLLAEDLRQTIDILAEITGGQITPQETLNNIFSHFCVGK